MSCNFVAGVHLTECLCRELGKVQLGLAGEATEILVTKQAGTDVEGAF